MIAGTADGRRVAVLVTGALTVLAALVTGLAGLAGSGGVARPSALTPSPAVTGAAEGATRTSPAPAAGVAEGAGDAPALGDGASGTGHGDLAQPAGIEEARQTAAAFAAGWSSYRFDEPAGAAMARVRPLLTEESTAALAAGSGAAAEQERRAATHEVVTATVDGVITGGFDGGHVLLAVVVLEQVTNDSGTIHRSVAYEVSVERRDGRWLINAVTAG